MMSCTTPTDTFLDKLRTSLPNEDVGEPEAIAAAVVAELEAAYSAERLKALVARGGRE